MMKALGENVPGYKIRDMIKEVDLDRNETVEFGEFVTVSKYVKFRNTLPLIISGHNATVLQVEYLGIDPRRFPYNDRSADCTSFLANEDCLNRRINAGNNTIFRC